MIYDSSFKKKNILCVRIDRNPKILKYKSDTFVILNVASKLKKKIVLNTMKTFIIVMRYFNLSIDKSNVYTNDFRK